MIAEDQLRNLKDISYREAGIYENTRFERSHNVVYDNAADASRRVAEEIAALIRKKQQENKSCVLGLATGSSPIRVYEELIRMHKEEGLSFFNVVTFNLDEYFPMNEQNVQSYHYFMNTYLFDHIDIPRENIHIPKGNIDPEQVLQFCVDYEEKIKAFGGLDFQLLGIGRTGHIGFNEPGSHFNSRTRMVTLDHLTRMDASPAFLGLENVPKKAVTMGISTVMEARRVVLLAWGSGKAPIVKRAIEGEMSSQVPATYLQEHPNTTYILDSGAASELTRIKTPWLVGPCDWDMELTRKAVVWLCEQTSKSILKLTDKDYNDHGMEGLLAKEGSSYDLNIKMFNALQHTITGWPGGKPGADDEYRPERALPKTKKAIIFSPHPDDDVISMGGTFDRLVEQGHEVHVVYQTSGNIAVSNDDALKYAEVAVAMLGESEFFTKVISQIEKRQEYDQDTMEIRRLKGMIRQKESLAATRFLGLPDTQVHFLNLPFYETGSIKKNPLGAEDLALMCEVINRIQPNQIYAAGDLADPHGTHKTCLDAVFAAVEELKKESFMKDCWVWLYRGAWLEWDMHEIDMAVPMSPDQVLKKRKAIFYHQSQKDGVMFQGDDSREFWVRAEDRNMETARKYRELGFADYAAMEAFKRYYF